MLPSSNVTCGGGLLSLLVILVAYLYSRHANVAHLETVLDGLLRTETAVTLDTNIRVAVGFGSCVDVIGPGLDILKKFGALAPDMAEHFDSVHSQQEFEKVFAYFFQHGAAAERYTTNETFFRSIASIAKAVPGTKVVVGGNAPVMVNCFRKQGVKVLLGAQMTDELREKIGWDVEVAGDDVTEDDIHLILEYKKGEQWGAYKAARANRNPPLWRKQKEKLKTRKEKLKNSIYSIYRFIIHNDANNPGLSALDKFADALVSFAPQLIVVGGLQMMDNFPYLPGQRRSRLDRLSAILSAVSLDTRVHFEMASFTERDCLQDIVDTVVRYSDSLGMNEQELPNLLGLLLTSEITLLSDAYPRVATTLDQMRRLYTFLRRTTVETQGRRKITRLHVHTLAFQAIITEIGSPWKNSRSAAAKASLAASRHTCGSAHVSVNKSRLLMDESFSTSRQTNSSTGRQRIDFDSNEPVSCWIEKPGEGGEVEREEGEWDGEGVEICIAPVLVCTSVVQTVGGGDNISSAGLVLQI